MLYILECMLYGLFCLHGGNNKPLLTTGEDLTINDIGVCLLGWSIVFMIIFSIVYCRDFVAHKNIQDRRSKKFYIGLLYMAECIVLGAICLRSGKNTKLRSTGKKPTSKEAVFCMVIWIYILIMIVSIVLICI